MYRHQIVDMVDILVRDANVVHEKDRQATVNALASYWNDRVAHTWCIEDIQSRDETLTDTQAREILKILLLKFDAGIGINWDVIDARIDEYRSW